MRILENGYYEIMFLNGNIRTFRTLEGASLISANLEGVDLRNADLRNADLRDADLTGADLRDANLYGAYLEGANLRGANLYGANLRGADLYNTSVLSFQLGKHFGFYHEGYVKIGCHGHKLDYWLEHFETIGKENRYSKKEVSLYGSMLKMIKSEKLGE